MGALGRIGANVAVGAALLGGGYFAAQKGMKNEASLLGEERVVGREPPAAAERSVLAKPGRHVEPAIELKGQALGLALLEEQLERRAREKNPAATLVDYTIVGANDATIDPSQGESLRVVYGTVGSDLVVKKNAELSAFEYGKAGLTTTSFRARTSLRSVVAPGCLASKVIALYAPASLDLVTEGDSAGAVWTAKLAKPKKKTVLLSLEDCSLTKRRK